MAQSPGKNRRAPVYPPGTVAVNNFDWPPLVQKSTFPFPITKLPTPRPSCLSQTHFPLPHLEAKAPSALRRLWHISLSSPLLLQPRPTTSVNMREIVSPPRSATVAAASSLVPLILPR